MTRLSLIRIIALAALALGGCAAIDPIARNGGRPERIVLSYDFTGAWAATAGDECVPRLDMSDQIFVSIAADPNGSANRFHIDRFFMLDPGERAGALLGTMNPDGILPLEIEAEDVIDGQKAPVTYGLRLEAQDASHIRLIGFTMTVRAVQGDSTVDLLATAASNPEIPILLVVGQRGLCLKRL